MSSILLFILSMVVPTAGTTTQTPLLGLAIFLISLFQSIISGLGVMTLFLPGPDYPIPQLIAAFYFGSIWVTNVPLLLSAFRAPWRTRTTVPRWLSSSSLAAATYASLVPVIPTFDYSDLLMPYGVWLAALWTNCIALMIWSNKATGNDNVNSEGAVQMRPMRSQRIIYFFIAAFAVVSGIYLYFYAETQVTLPETLRIPMRTMADPVSLAGGRFDKDSIVRLVVIHYREGKKRFPSPRQEIITNPQQLRAVQDILKSTLSTWEHLGSSKLSLALSCRFVCVWKSGDQSGFGLGGRTLLCDDNFCRITPEQSSALARALELKAQTNTPSPSTPG